MNLPNYTVARQTTALAGDPIIDAMQEGFCELDREGRVVRVNQALCKMTGFEPMEILGTSQPFPFWPEEEMDRLQRMFYTPLEEGQIHQVTFKRKSGQRFTAMVSPSAVTNEVGEIVTFFATIKDISELMASRKRQRMLSLVADKTTDAVQNVQMLRGTIQDIDASVRARMEREKMSEIRQVIDTSPVVHFKLKMGKKGDIAIDYINESINKIDSRLHADKLISKEQNFGEVLGRLRLLTVAKGLSECAKNDIPLKMELVIDGEDGDIYTELYAESELTDDGTIAWYGHIQDVTSTFQRNVELEQLVAVSKSQNQRLLDFAQILSHNVRLHSSTIDGLIQVIDETDDITEQEQFIAYLKDTSSKLDETLHDLNSVLMIRSNTDADSVRLPAVELLQNRAGEWQDMVNEVGGEFHLKISPEFNADVDADLFNSVMEELIGNAIRFRSEHRPLQLTISADITDIRTKAVIVVSDNGIGIDLSRNESYLFGMYRTFHPGVSGKGMGLFLAKNMAESMHCELQVQSKEDAGTKVILECSRML